ncbi:hypothetical protein ACIQNG_01545 [Streptomyces sp. NPDC091377]|uniref:hypothetical protein n=1 Tax=unclassified Streptomyces TaxID=2593676 RepID=UPI00380299F8
MEIRAAAAHDPSSSLMDTPGAPDAPPGTADRSGAPGSRDAPVGSCGCGVLDVADMGAS